MLSENGVSNGMPFFTKSYYRNAWVDTLLKATMPELGVVRHRTMLTTAG